MHMTRVAAVGPRSHRPAPTCDLTLRVLAPGRCEPVRLGRPDAFAQKPANRVSASPNSASSTPIRSMMPRYRLHNWRLSSPDAK